MGQEVEMISVDEALEYGLKHFEPLEPAEAPVTLRVIADLAAGYTADLVVEPGRLFVS